MTTVSGSNDSPLSDRDRHMRNLIAQLNLLSWVPASAASPNGGPATDESPGGKMPKGGGMSGADWWRLYVQTPDRTIAQAEEALASAVRGPVERPAGETPEQEVARKTARVLALHADGGWTTNDMARDTGLTVGQVSRVIADSFVAVKVTARERAREAQVVLVASKGLSVRKVAQVTGVPKSTVQRILERRAA
jgi:hypothetical protein